MIIKNFIFNELDLHRIEAACLETNEGSLNVLKKNNFSMEGRARKYLKINGKWQDHLIFSCLDNED